VHIEHGLLLRLTSLDLFGTLQGTNRHNRVINHLHEVKLAAHTATIAHVAIASEGKVTDFESVY